ncbi:integrase core domain-containing protein, partial [Klebsiella pneumoniae]
ADCVTARRNEARCIGAGESRGDYALACFIFRILRRPLNDWRQDYNECRPHSSLNYQTPSEFAAGWRNGKHEEKSTDITN